MSLGCNLDEEEDGPKGIPGRPLLESESDGTGLDQRWEKSSFSSSSGVGHCVAYLLRFRGRCSEFRSLRLCAESLPVGEGRPDGMLGSKRSLRSVMYLSNFSALACNRFTHCRSG